MYIANLHLFRVSGVNKNTPLYATGITIPTASVGSTLTVTGVSVQPPTPKHRQHPSRATMNEAGERIGVRIGTQDVTALSTDLPDTVGEGAVDQHYSGIVTASLTGWEQTVISGGQIVVRHASAYTGSTADDTLSVYNVAVTVQTCTPATGGTTTTSGDTATSVYTWDSFDRLTSVTVGGTVTERMWYAAGVNDSCIKTPTVCTSIWVACSNDTPVAAALRINGSTRSEQQ